MIVAAAGAVVAEAEAAPSLTVHVWPGRVREALEPALSEASAEALLRLLHLAGLIGPFLVGVIERGRRNLGLGVDRALIREERGQGVHLAPVASRGNLDLFGLSQPAALVLV